MEIVTKIKIPRKRTVGNYKYFKDVCVMNIGSQLPLTPGDPKKDFGSLVKEETYGKSGN